MLALTGHEHFYFIPGCTDMRYGYRKLTEIVRHKFLRDPLNGDVYIFMFRALLARTEGSNSARRTTVRMFQFENHAYYIHEKHYVSGYKFMDIQTDDDGRTYYISWEDLISVLETPVVKTLRLDKVANSGRKKS